MKANIADEFKGNTIAFAAPLITNVEVIGDGVVCNVPTILPHPKGLVDGLWNQTKLFTVGILRTYSSNFGKCCCHWCAIR